MNAESALSCPQCATPRDIYRYCMNCGFDFSADPVADIVDHTGAEEPPIAEVVAPVVGGSSASVMLVIIGVAAAVILLVAAALFIPFAGREETPGAGDATRSPADRPSDNATEPSEPTCWNGTSAAASARCPAPTGSAGLAWVFPSLNPNECTDKGTDNGTDKGRGKNKPAKWVCKISLDEGGTVRIRYREHKSVDKARARFSQTYGASNRDSVLSERDDVVRYVWRAAEADGEDRWSLSSMYAEHPWSVTIKGDSTDEVGAALSDLVEFRNPRRLDR